MSMVQNESKLKKNLTSLMGWVDERFPATETFEYHMSRYPAPKNFAPRDSLPVRLGKTRTRRRLTSRSVPAASRSNDWPRADRNGSRHTARSCGCYGRRCLRGNPSQRRARNASRTADSNNWNAKIDHRSHWGGQMSPPHLAH